MIVLKLELIPNEAGIFIYKPGDVLRGCVELNIKSDKKCSSLYIELIGQVTTQIYSEENKIKSTDSLLYKKLTFFAYQQPTKISSGKHQYEFEFELPSILPYSLKFNSKNKIEYFAKASLVSNEKSKYVEQQMDFEIFNDYDLNINPLNFIGQHCEGVIDTCSLFCKNGSILCSASIPYAGFVEGQIIPVTIKYVNQTRSRILGIIIDLEQLIEIRCSNPAMKMMEFKNKITNKTFPDNDLQQTTFCFTKASDEFKIFVTVPYGIFLSNSHVCNLIQIKYFLDITVITNSCRSILQLRIPIEIGTKRIRSNREPGSSSFLEHISCDLTSLENRESGLVNCITRSEGYDLNGNAIALSEAISVDHHLVSLGNGDVVSSQQLNKSDEPPEYNKILPSYEEVMNPGS